MLDIASTTRHLRGIADLDADDFNALLDLASVMKRHPLAWRNALEGRAIACLFEQPSTRTRVALEVAASRLGALPVVLAPGELAHGDSLAETASALSSYCDAIALRTPHHRDLLELASHASVPVLNLRTDREDPFHALAGCLSLRERFGDLRGLPVACVGGGEALAYSLIEAAMLTGLEVRVATLRPDPALLARAGERVRVCASVHEAVEGAAAVYDGVSSVAADLLPVQQAVLRALVTGDLEL